ncbi:MAG: hypothetical protein WCN98_06650 [Verrucomicrobiaceae bacterium]
MSDDPAVNRPTESVPMTLIRLNERREFIRRLSKAGLTLPVAAVIYNANATIAHAY